ncbi:MAG: YSC84-related protein [Gammaproteobacteria bacterium]
MSKVHIAIVSALLLLAGSSFAGDVEIKDYSETINQFKEDPAIAPLMSSAYGFAVFPKIGKGGLGIGAARGRGQVYQGGKVTGITSLTDISIGFQAGGQAYSQLVLFEDQKAYDNFTSGNFEFDAGASAIAIQASASAEAGTTGTGTDAAAGGDSEAKSAKYTKGLLVFTIAKGGLMYEASIGGQKYSFEAVE